MTNEYRYGKNGKDPLDLQVSALSKDQVLELMQAFSGIRNIKGRMARVRQGMWVLHARV